MQLYYIKFDSQTKKIVNLVVIYEARRKNYYHFKYKLWFHGSFIPTTYLKYGCCDEEYKKIFEIYLSKRSF